MKNNRTLECYPRLSILLGAPFTQQNVERMGLPQLSQHFDIQIIDCAKIIGRNPEAIAIQKADWPRYDIVHSPGELHDALLDFRPRWAIDNIGLDHNTTWIANLLKESNIKLVCVKSGILPRPSLRSSLHSFLLRRDNAPTTANNPTPPGQPAYQSSLWNRLIWRIIHEWHLRTRMPAPDLALLAGRDALQYIDAKKATERIWIGSEDFYLFQKTAEQIRHGKLIRRNQPFLLFIDSCLPYATDWKFLGIAPPITAEEYYPLLRGLFERLEILTGMPVVVAGHPNSRWVPNYDDLLGGREMVLGSTAALVMQANLVLNHASTATSFIALAGKPSIFVSSISLATTSYNNMIQAMAKSLNSPLIMLEDAASLQEAMIPHKADLAACQRYIDLYLRCRESVETGPWQALIDYIS